MKQFISSNKQLKIVKQAQQIYNVLTRKIQKPKFS